MQLNDTTSSKKNSLIKRFKKIGCVGSIRNSNYGYVNAPDVHISFSPLEQYVTDIENAVGSGQLSAEKELYSAARLRSVKTSRDFLPKCISYLEFRLEQQGYTPDTVLPEGSQTFLRGNSNISTGGDSIDMTAQMGESYKQLAADMATAMRAWACGVNLIIPDYTKPASKELPNCTCIELNFNPAMYLHTYTYAGPGQRITPKILRKLFGEI